MNGSLLNIKQQVRAGRHVNSIKDIKLVFIYLFFFQICIILMVTAYNINISTNYILVKLLKLNDVHLRLFLNPKGQLYDNSF